MLKSLVSACKQMDMLPWYKMLYNIGNLSDLLGFNYVWWVGLSHAAVCSLTPRYLYSRENRTRNKKTQSLKQSQGKHLPRAVTGKTDSTWEI